MQNPAIEINRIHQLQHQAVRDLAWCCLSAPLLAQLPGTASAMLPLDDLHLWPWLTALDQQPQPLLAELDKLTSTRLGIYYEALWRFYFSHSADWRLLAHNLQINRGKTTLGAFDFLCQRGDEYWHIETAVKFYLCHNRQEAQHWHNWIGPGSNDRLDLKLAHLRDHQLPLHQTDEGRQLLQQRFPAASRWKSGLCLQGYLFSPAPQDLINPADRDNILSPTYSNAYHGSGYWWYLQDFFHFMTQTQAARYRWLILPHHHWLSPAQAQSDQCLPPGPELRGNISAQLTAIKKPLLIAALTTTAFATSTTASTTSTTAANNQPWRERFRAFILPDKWPVL